MPQNEFYKIKSNRLKNHGTIYSIKVHIIQYTGMEISLFQILKMPFDYRFEI